MRHQMFLLRGLSLLFATLALAPFFLAFHGAPTLPQTVIFGLCLAPLGAIMLVSKTGRLDRGHAIHVCSLIGIAVVSLIAGEAGLGSALAWLIVAQAESLVARNRGLAQGTGLVVVLVFSALAAGTASGWLVLGYGRAGGDLAVGFALAYAISDILILVDGGVDTRDAEKRARARAATLAALIDDLVVSYDPDGNVDFVGRGCERIVGLPDSDLTGRGLFEHIHVADRPIFLTAVADAAHGVPTILATFRLRTTNTTFRWVEMRALGLQTSQPTSGHVVSLLRDVTAVRQHASDLEDARQAAVTSSRSQDHFIANMSHELRTPLNAIIGFSEILGDQSFRPHDPAKQVEYARIIHQSGQHLLAVVNSILDMSKLQSGTFSIMPDTFDVAPLIDSCCEIVSLKAREGRVEMVRAPRRAIEQVYGDPRACKQILLNLLSNAIKFTPENGRVVVDARPEGNSLLVSVVDTGIGIGAADLAQLGDPFFQAKAAHDRPFEGTGLGLSVVRGLVGLHGGTITIESELGHGTNVTVRLPLDCRFATRHDPTTKIETIPRRRSKDRISFANHDSMVKKSA